MIVRMLVLLPLLSAELNRGLTPGSPPLAAPQILMPRALSAARTGAIEKGAIN